ncbi:MAG: hypothetical protein WBG86_21055, partial [Polyangiales bacterium]
MTLRIASPRRSLLLGASLVALTLACERSPSPDPTATTGRSPAAAVDPALPGIDSPDAALQKTLATALASQAADYVPRTHHLGTDGAPRFTNRLILESSPYLLQHAHNPVN